ncbi:MAG TPA: MATE family efflux transporter, partial [Candidatus Babeliales bacterium]|nr:MATE family efflux transporter [Candidatus Babeliales bacterium]
MKRGIIASYVAGICDVNIGASYGSILRLFAPEFVSALILFSMINLLDARFIATLNSTATYATLGYSNTFLHFLVKIAEGMSLVITITAGQFNGLGEFKKAGHMLTDAFWLIVIMAAIISSFLFFGAPLIYSYLDVPADMVALGVPFLKLRAISIFFTFLYFAFTAFLRGIKNTQTPMRIFMLGAAVFVFFDYALIFGKFGFPEMKLQGSAIAGVIQYGFMFFALMILVLSDKTYRKYSISLFSSIADWVTIKRLANLSWPLMIDKATMAGAYVWLAKMIAPMGTHAIASYSVIKDIERVGFLPAIAFA